MLEKLKEDFYAMITGLGYNVSDNRNFETGNSPWLLLRSNGYQRVYSIGLTMSKITLVLDVFSKYNGEKEIIQVVDNVADHLKVFLAEHPEVLFCYQRTMKILDDNATGPIRKHGVISYEFLMGANVPIEEESEGEENE